MESCPLFQKLPMIVHTKHTSVKGSRVLTIVSSDTDVVVVVLAVAQFLLL